MSRILNTFLIAAVLAGFTLGGCGGNSSGASDAQVSAAVRASAKEMEPHESGDDGTEVPRFLSLLGQLRDVPALAPLFDLYKVPNPIVTHDDDEAAGLIQLLHAVSITVDSGTVTITNRQTSGVIYSAPISALDTGTFNAANLPGATTSTCTYGYSDWSACQNGTQTRTVASASPAGCLGTPVLSQSCTVTTPPPPATCSSFTYSAWGACQPDGTQARTVLGSSPAGCTGGAPVTTQACTYTPPIDGAALYGQYCSSCHGSLASSNLKGKNISVSLIKSFGMTQGLSDAQLQAIVTAVGP